MSGTVQFGDFKMSGAFKDQDPLLALALAGIFAGTAITITYFKYRPARERSR